jgi:hypothetical protein
MSTTTTNFKQSLQQRIVELTQRHADIIEEKAEWDNQVLSVYESRISEKESPSEAHTFAKRQSEHFSATAATVWDLKCEVEKCLSLYEVETQTISYDIESAANYISRCIKSCETEDQVATTEKMITGFSLLYPESTQRTSWEDSLKLAIHTKRTTLNLRTTFQ